MQLAKSAPVLVQLPQRQWGASATLPLDIVPGVYCSALLGCFVSIGIAILVIPRRLGDLHAEASSSERVGVLRDAFTPFHVRECPLHTTIQPLAEGQAAVNSSAAFAPQGIVVDEYIKDSANGVYRLTNVATDLLRYVLTIARRSTRLHAAVAPSNSSSHESATWCAGCYGGKTSRSVLSQMLLQQPSRTVPKQ